MEFITVYNEMRTDQNVKYDHTKPEAELRENFVQVEVFNHDGYFVPSLIKVTHGFNQLEDWSTRWIITSGNREDAIRHAIRVLDGYKLGQLCSLMEQWNENQEGGEH